MPARWPFGAGSTSTIRTRIQWLVVACAVPVALLAVALVLLSHRARARRAAAGQRARHAQLVQAVDHELDATIQVLQSLATADQHRRSRLPALSRAVARRAQARGGRQHRAVRRRIGGPVERGARVGHAAAQGAARPLSAGAARPAGPRCRKPSSARCPSSSRSRWRCRCCATARPIARLEMVFNLGALPTCWRGMTCPAQWTLACSTARASSSARTRDAQTLRRQARRRQAARQHPAQRARRLLRRPHRRRHRRHRRASAAPASTAGWPPSACRSRAAWRSCSARCGSRPP